MSELDHLWINIREALSEENARAFDGNDNFKKCLVIKTCVVGTELMHRQAVSPRDSEFAFEASIPRSAVNDLTFSVSCNLDRAEAAAFLRELADLIEGCR